MDDNFAKGDGRHPTVPIEATAPTLTHLGFIGRSRSLLDAVELLRRYAKSRAPILIIGETGTGKELAARALHYLGPRPSGPFVPANCGAYPESLFESALFGHERGAFTDASRRHCGLVAQAQGGTLFLDEIDSLTPRSQAALLRFLQEYMYRPLGGAGEHRSDTRVLAATNSDLLELADAGEFRSDLLYRLDVARVELPPLRHRPEDILLLAHHFLKKFSVLYGDGPSAFHPNTEKALLSHDWPGNVRELENVIHREFLRCDTDTIACDGRLGGLSANNIPASDLDSLSDASLLDYKSAKRVLLDSFEKRYTCSALNIAGGNVSTAARIARIERRAFGRLVKKHCIDRKEFFDC